MAAAWAACAPGEGPPEVVSNPDWQPPAVASLPTGARLVENVAPRETVRVERADRPPRGAALLFWDVQPVARDARGRSYVAETDRHRIWILDDRARPVAWRRPTGGHGERLARPVSVVYVGTDTLVAFETSGDVVLFDLWGRTFVRWPGPFDVEAGAALPDGRLVFARSPALFRFDLVQPGDPLLRVGAPGAEPAPVDSATPPPEDFWYAGIAWNAGPVAAGLDGRFAFASLARPEIRAYDARGRLLWVARRPVPFPVEVPRLVLVGEGRRPRLRLHTVHKALAWGPDGLLYVRAAADTLGARDRLEVFDPETGAWQRTAPLDTGTLVFVNSLGRVWEVPATAVRLEEPSPDRRTPLPDYAVPTLAGDTVRLADARGRVLVVSVWASWCRPCEEELPLLDTLYRTTSRAELEVHAISEDVDAAAARAFARALDLSFPLLWARGAQRARFGYQGLPYTVLADRRGRIVREFYGFGGRDDFMSRVVPLLPQEIERGP